MKYHASTLRYIIFIESYLLMVYVDWNIADKDRLIMFFKNM